ncbi:hypothetical protein SARC_07311, partial [Sphaeroforma arctica JP610]
MPHLKRLRCLPQSAAEAKFVDELLRISPTLLEIHLPFYTGITEPAVARLAVLKLSLGAVPETLKSDTLHHIEATALKSENAQADVQRLLDGCRNLRTLLLPKQTLHSPINSTSLRVLWVTALSSPMLSECSQLVSLRCDGFLCMDSHSPTERESGKNSLHNQTLQRLWISSTVYLDML